jgi:hypothetical protein
MDMGALVHETPLRRMLEGNRFRVGNCAWVPAKARLVGSLLAIDFDGRGGHGGRRVIVELPGSFDLADPNHRAWLWSAVERMLAENSN